MQNVVVVRKWANSRAIIIPKHIHKELQWRVGDLLYITHDGHQLMLQRAVISPLRTNQQTPIAGDPPTGEGTSGKARDGNR